jgi:hypothetical protein
LAESREEGWVVGPVGVDKTGVSVQRWGFVHDFKHVHISGDAFEGGKDTRLDQKVLNWNWIARTMLV